MGNTDLHNQSIRSDFIESQLRPGNKLDMRIGSGSFSNDVGVTMDEDDMVDKVKGGIRGGMLQKMER